MQVVTHLDMGGAEEVAISLAEALHGEVEFIFFAVQGVASTAIGQEFLHRLDRCSIPVYSGTELEMKRGGPLQAGFRLAQLVRRLKPDIVHLHTEIPETTFACASLFRLPRDLTLIRTVHNSSLWPAWAWVGRWTEQHLGAARIAAVSQAGLRGLWNFQDARGLARTPAERCQVIYNGVARDEVTALTETPSAPPGGRPLRVLFAGRFEAQKGVDLLPAIVEEAARHTSRPVQLSIAGSGTHAGLLEDWVARGSTTWNVELSPPITGLATRLREQRYDLLLMPSRFEGLSLMAIEALLAGIPVVATRVAGLLEVFPDEYPLLARSEDVTGLGQLLAQAINHWEEHRVWAQGHVPEVAARFNLREMAHQYFQLYLQVVLLRPGLQGA